METRPTTNMISGMPNAGKNAKISGRELEIVQLLSEGLISQQIADKLQLSKHTVDTHRRNLIRKTGSKNSIEVVANCKKQGLC